MSCEWWSYEFTIYSLAYPQVVCFIVVLALFSLLLGFYCGISIILIIDMKNVKIIIFYMGQT